jgi:hypothetical protein
MRTIEQIIAALPGSSLLPLAAPAYTGDSPVGIALAVECMKRLTTDEGWQLMAGLEHAGYTLCGRRLTLDTTCVSQILDITKPGVVVVQDICEWAQDKQHFRDSDARFDNLSTLRRTSDLFKVAILKDAQLRPDSHKHRAAELEINAWIIYYNPRIVLHLAPFVRERHLVRTYHSIDADAVPAYSDKREGCLLSGAVSSDYPLRERLAEARLPGVSHLKHPGYALSGSATPAYLQTLSQYKVAICTSSIYGYALRKIVEATACGCVVVTDLPIDDVLPEIDGNMVRIHPQMNLLRLSGLLHRLCATYDAQHQRDHAERARSYYDYRAIGRRLAADIEQLRSSWETTTRERGSALTPGDIDVTSM